MNTFATRNHFHCIPSHTDTQENRLFKCSPYHHRLSYTRTAYNECCTITVLNYEHTMKKKYCQSGYLLLEAAIACACLGIAGVIIYTHLDHLVTALATKKRERACMLHGHQTLCARAGFLNAMPQTESFTTTFELQQDSVVPRFTWIKVRVQHQDVVADCIGGMRI